LNITLLDNPKCIDYKSFVTSNPEDSQGSHTSDIKEVNYSWVRKRMNMAGEFKLAASSAIYL
jgi:hypothetical protein